MGGEGKCGADAWNEVFHQRLVARDFIMRDNRGRCQPAASPDLDPDL